MRKRSSWAALLVLTALLGLAAAQTRRARQQDLPAVARLQGKAAKVDSYYYYGPGGLAKYWNDPNNKKGPAERLGRDTWIHWTWGNQKFLRRLSVMMGRLPVPISIDFFRILDSRNRKTRFRDLGLINEPNCESCDRPDEYGLYLDHWKGDPLNYYPGDAKYREKYGSTYPGSKGKIDERHYGWPTGVVGLRLFPNPAFTAEAKKQWNVREYFKNPGLMEPPYLVGFSCAFCHIAFDPTNPPADPENPRWENLAANLGNQYFREGEVFLAGGRAVFGDLNPDPAAPDDYYRTRGLLEKDFLFQYAVTQQPGTSETSRITYDFINNPNSIPPIMNLPLRLPLAAGETSFAGQKAVNGLNILKDGADSVGLRWALMRVPINIFCEGDYLLERVYNPLTGRRQKPFRIAEVLAGLPPDDRKQVEKELGPLFRDVSPEYRKELQLRLRSPWSTGEEFGQDWEETWRRSDPLAQYLLSYRAAALKDAATAANPADAKAAQEALPTDKDVAAGKELFLKWCADCHSSTLPGKTGKDLEAARKAFPKGDYLADDKRYSARPEVLGTNLARTLGTNAIEDDIWAEFSSREYKAQRPLGRIRLKVPVFPPNAPLPLSVKKPIEIDFEPPGGGRGYYRTPSLLGMWATAPYLHNNAVGDYWVITDTGKSEKFPNDGGRIGRKLPNGTWVNYRIDVSVAGRLKMFEDGMDKMLNPERRRWWVKRTSADSTLIPNLSRAVPQLLLAITRDIIRREVAAWLKGQTGLESLEKEAVQIIERVFARVAPGVGTDVGVTLRLGWAVAHLKLREHADRLFDLVYDDLKDQLEKKLAREVSLARFKPVVRQALMARLDRLDRDLRQAAILTIPAGTPVNLYANLNANTVLYAALAHVRYRNDPRGLARALLELSDCPDLVEDKGHTYGQDLTAPEKRALIAFLKTL
jgi:hypothetical protein